MCNQKSETMETIRQVELRCMGHRLAAEHYASLDNGFRMAATVMAALSTSASYWSITETNPILNYVLAGLSTVTTITNAVMSMWNIGNLANGHRTVAKALDYIRLTYIGDLMDSAKPDAERDELVRRMRVDVSNILKDAPLLPSYFENAAQADLQHRGEMSSPGSPRAGRKSGDASVDVSLTDNVVAEIDLLVGPVSRGGSCESLGGGVQECVQT